MLPDADRIKLLHAQGKSAADISVITRIEYRTVCAVLELLAPAKRTPRVGRPSTDGRCAHCGAPPSHQRPIVT